MKFLILLAALLIAGPALAASTIPYESSALTSGQMPVADSTADGKLKASACTDNGTLVTCTEPLVAPANVSTGAGSISASGNANIIECSTTCTVTLPAPVVGSQQCIRNEAAVATVITIAAITSVQFEKTDNSGYGTVTTGTMTAAGANGDKVCLVGRDTTHYDVFSFKGTWTNS